jgi:hypothetical protein
LGNELGAVLRALAKLVYVVALVALVIISWQMAVTIFLIGLVFLHIPGAYLQFKAGHSVAVKISRRW